MGCPVNQCQAGELQAEINRLRVLLTNCAEQFEHYAKGHRQKGADDKAAVNQGWADMIRRGLC